MTVSLHRYFHYLLIINEICLFRRFFSTESYHFVFDGKINNP